jgi:CRISPR-associated protein Cas6
VTIDLVFPARGDAVAVDHAYPLYAALSGLVPQFHDPATALRFAPLTGDPAGDGRLRLTDRSCLRVRVPDDAVRVVLPLAGQRLDVGGRPVRLGVPSVRTLTPAASLVARLVTFKGADGPDPFLATARAKLAALGVSGEPGLPVHLDGDRAGEPVRRVVRIKGATIWGYALVVSELSAADSLTLQAHGLGGRTQLGCGFFVPARGVG